MTLSGDLLEQLGIHVSPETMEQVLLEALARVAGRLPVADPRRDLTADEARALEQGGLQLEPIDLGAEDPVLRAAAEHAAIVGHSVTVPQAAARLGVDPSRIRHRLAARTLYGIRTPDGWRLPEFQFEGNALVPGFEKVAVRLDPELHPVEVWRWFTSPDPDLVAGDGEVALSPREWLCLRYEPNRVARLAADL